MKRKLKYTITTTAGILLLLWLFCLPQNLFEDVPYSTVVTDKNGKLLGARVADDGQWRFPQCDSIPEKFVKALIEFEDRSFYSHPGVSISAIARAVVQNIQNGRIVSGGSTITMQVIRISRHKPRTPWQKIIEMFMATRLEARYSKEEILRMYASHAPFGGNVVGIDAAIWRYLGDENCELSWAEAATLAVLQNSPAHIHLDKNRDALLAKRNRLLTRLHDKGELTDDEYESALEEPLIGSPHPMPQYVPHLIEYYNRTAHGEKSHTAINLSMQRKVDEVITRWSKEFRLSGIRDMAAVIVNAKTGEIIAYCGNSDMSFERDGKWVDIARASRSSGSILKPLLYAAALQDGIIMPNTLLSDVPTDFHGFSPKNFDGTFTGVVSANEALSLSLNVPYVYLLQEYGTERFVKFLKQAGIKTLNRRADQYGLSLILGGGEVSLTDIVECYSRMAAVYVDSTACPNFPLRDRIALYHTFNAMREINRPNQIDWRRAVSVPNVAWKTGTSYGSRDAWAIGVTPEYAVGIWVGNADGSGVANLTGARYAGPVLFDLFNLLPNAGWFDEPNETDGARVNICSHSGHIAGKNCTESNSILAPKNCMKSRACPYCMEAAISLDGKRRVTDCSEPYEMRKFFVLPPKVELYYKQQHHEYVHMPKLLENGDNTMSFTYPKEGCIITLPQLPDRAEGWMVCKITHSNDDAEIFWYIDGSFLGTTTVIHQMKISPSTGLHKITAVDLYGNVQSISITVRR